MPEEKQFDERTLHIDRVARVVKGGRRFRFRALVVVGDRKGKVGIGIAKGADVTAAVTKATEVAKKNFINVSLYKGTLPHETEAKVSWRPHPAQASQRRYRSDRRRCRPYHPGSCRCQQRPQQVTRLDQQDQHGLRHHRRPGQPGSSQQVGHHALSQATAKAKAAADKDSCQARSKNQRKKAAKAKA